MLMEAIQKSGHAGDGRIWGDFLAAKAIGNGGFYVVLPMKNGELTLGKARDSGSKSYDFEEMLRIHLDWSVPRSGIWHFQIEEYLHPQCPVPNPCSLRGRAVCCSPGKVKIGTDVAASEFYKSDEKAPHGVRW